MKQKHILKVKRLTQPIMAGDHCKITIYFECPHIIQNTKHMIETHIRTSIKQNLKKNIEQTQKRDGFGETYSNNNEQQINDKPRL